MGCKLGLGQGLGQERAELRTLKNQTHQTICCLADSPLHISHATYTSRRAHTHRANRVDVYPTEASPRPSSPPRPYYHPPSTGHWQSIVVGNLGIFHPKVLGLITGVQSVLVH
jgi:uncharacterized protein involved in type VI secretion and phage assembly